uniref:Uncharacterized protein n=1 Tax=Anopheles atroparvus TaxID=41427 RepID=A0A182JHF3_ANOAO
MDQDKRYDHVRALVSSIHGSFPDAALLDTVLDRTNNNSPSQQQATAATTPTTPDGALSTERTILGTDVATARPVDGQERAAADGAAATPHLAPEGAPRRGSSPSSLLPSAGNANSHSTPTRLLQHRLRIPSLVVTSSLLPYHPGPLQAGSADTEHTPRRFSFAIMRRHSNTRLVLAKTRPGGEEKSVVGPLSAYQLGYQF